MFENWLSANYDGRHLSMKLARRSIQRQAARAARAVFRFVLFVCMCASLWRAPLPWLHHHEGRDAAEFSENMSRHLDVWHGNTASDESGLHLHFAMLDDILRGGGCPVPPDEHDDEPPPTIQQVIPGNHVVNAAETLLASVHSIIVWSDALHSNTAAVGRADLRRRPVDDRTAARRLLTVLCIAQC